MSHAFYRERRRHGEEEPLARANAAEKIIKSFLWFIKAMPQSVKFQTKTLGRRAAFKSVCVFLPLSAMGLELFSL